MLTNLASQCAAPEPAPEPSPAERGPIAQEYLNQRLAVWQQRLQLQSWKVSLSLSRRGGLRPGTRGNIHWDADLKTARIRVLDPSEYQTRFEATLSDMEFTVVHELIHLELASLPRSDASRSDEEHAVNRMAEALLQLDRQSMSASIVTPEMVKLTGRNSLPDRALRAAAAVR